MQAVPLRGITAEECSLAFVNGWVAFIYRYSRFMQAVSLRGIAAEECSSVLGRNLLLKKVDYRNTHIYVNNILATNRLQ